MAQQPGSTREPTQQVPEKGFAATMAQKAVEPIAAAAATAGAAYVTRKSSELWKERIAPKIEEQGGARQAVEDALSRVSDTAREQTSKASAKVREQASSARSVITEKIGGLRERRGGAGVAAGQAKPRSRRAAERKERKQRRAKRERALQRSASS